MRNRFKLKIINISFILFLLASNAKAQTYFPLPDTNTTWNVGWYPVSSKTNIFAVKGDTIHNSIVYKKYFTVNDTNLSIAQFVYFAMVRQDTINKTVYGILHGYTSERLLYNFNVNVNDTFSVHAFYLGGDYYSLKVKVLAKDSVLINSQYRKRIAINGYSLNNSPEYWIEGIGSLYGIFNGGGSGWLGTDMCMSALMCQKQNGILNYVNPSCVTCFDDQCVGNVGIQELSSNDNFKIYPNPGNGILTIESPELFSTPGIKLKITNVLGQTILECAAQNKIDISAASKGIYFLEIYEKEKLITTEKIIKE